MRRVRLGSVTPTAMLTLAAIVGMGLFPIQSADAATASGFEGGGFTNVVAVDPRATGIVIAGADLGGFQVGTGYGSSFASRNAGAQYLPDMSVATVVFATRTSNTYAGTGNGTGPTSGFWRSQDGGRTWIRLGSGEVFPDFAGMGVTDVRLRSTGRLIVLDETTNPNGHPAVIYAATTKGVMRSTDGGDTWVVIGLADVTRELRGIAMEPTDPSTLYVASHDDGVYVTHNATAPDPSAVAFTQISGASIPGSPVFPEEFLVLNDDSGSSLYVAAAGPSLTGGVYEYRDGTWIRWGADVLLANTWSAIDGYVDGTGRHLIVGCHHSCQRDPATGLYQDLYRSDDGGATWTPLLVDPDRIHPDHVGGPGGPAWWLAPGNSRWMMGGSQYKIPQIAIDPNNHRRIFVAGSQGLWKSEDGGMNWYPVVHEMLVGIGFGVAVDRIRPNRVYTASADWSLVYSTDRGATIAQSKPANSGGNGTAVAADPVTGRVYLSVGQHTGTDRAEIYSSNDPSNPDAWVSERLAQAPGEKGQRADGLVIGRGQSPVIVAAVVGSGIWRKVIRSGPGSGTWRREVIRPEFGIEVRASSVPGSTIVYVYDHTTTGELYVSSDGGKTWGSGPIWTLVSSPGMTGFIAADPTDPSRVYVSTNRGLYVLTDTTTDPLVTQITTMPDPTPGPVAVHDDGTVWVSGKTGDLIGTDLYRSSDGGQTWESVGDELYRNTVELPHAMVIAPDGYLYIGTRGNSMIVQSPLP
jgi:photosystem II stability/assembly factor-like uncharacterized protein